MIFYGTVSVRGGPGGNWSDENSPRLIMAIDPVFVPFAKTVAAPELLISCPGSARVRPVWQALPAYGCSCSGRAARPVRSQAEPGTEKAPGTKAVRVGTRKALPISPIFISPGGNYSSVVTQEKREAHYTARSTTNRAIWRNGSAD